MDIYHALENLEPERQAISRTVMVSKESPLRIILAVDDSGSMTSNRAKLTMRAIRKFVLELQLQINGVSGKIYFSMIMFGSDAKIIAENVDLVSLDIERNFIPISGRHGGTNLAPPLRLARQIIHRTRFSSSDPPPWICIFTDGSAQDPFEALQEAASLKRLPLPGMPPRIAVFAIAEQVDIELYQKLATTSEHYMPLSGLDGLIHLLPELGP
jgi:Mg-chelatase subunit ChlD